MSDVPAPLHRAREITVRALCDHFAQDRLQLADFEARLDRAHRARSVDELDALLAGLPALATPPAPQAAAAPPQAAPGARAPRTAPPGQTSDFKAVVAIMGGAERRGQWLPARRTLAFGCMGGVELDFRDALFAAGTTEIMAVGIMGGVSIIVPPGLAVDTSGFALMGAVEQQDHVPVQPDPDAPRLLIRGFALMGGVEVVVRLPGESAGDARRRRKLESRAARDRLRDGS